MVYFPYIPECKGGLRMAYASSIDFSGGLALNGNDPSFYLAHLRRFAQDTSLLPLSDALAQGDVHQAFLLAHTLKGLSAQLAVTCVYRPAAVLCNLLRDGSADPLPSAQNMLSAQSECFLSFTKEGLVSPFFCLYSRYISVFERGKRALPPRAVNPFVFLPPLWYHNRD